MSANRDSQMPPPHPGVSGLGSRLLQLSNGTTTTSPFLVVRTAMCREASIHLGLSRGLRSWAGVSASSIGRVTGRGQEMGRNVMFTEKGRTWVASSTCAEGEVLPAGEGHVRDLGPVFLSAFQFPQWGERPCLRLCLATKNLMRWAVACS